MTLDDIAVRLRPHGLAAVGAFHPEPDDEVPGETGTLIMIGASGDGMWSAFSSSPEFADSEPHPLDRWSARVISRTADEIGATPLFPFGGPPYQPFQRWATRAEGAVVSPVAMQVTPTRGLWTSYRGALALCERLTLATPALTSPCTGCPGPCRTACPVSAFAGGSYDVARCIAHVQSDAGAACRSGCLVRMVCPAATEALPPLVQRTFHMDAFLRANSPPTDEVAH